MRHTFIASFLLASILPTGIAAVSQPKADSSAQELRISTGVTAPQLLQSSDLHISSSGLELGYPNNAKVVIFLNIDAQGNVQHVHIVNSTYPVLNANVLDAASKFHFHPAMLDGKAIASHVELNVNIVR
jgi:TonB family protein